MKDHKTFIEKWKDFWLFWYEPYDFFITCLGVSMLIVSVSGSIATLRWVGLI